MSDGYITFTPATITALTEVVKVFMDDVMWWHYEIESISRDPNVKTTNVLFSLPLEEWYIKVKVKEAEEVNTKTLYLTLRPEKDGDKTTYVVREVIFEPGWRVSADYKKGRVEDNTIRIEGFNA